MTSAHGPVELVIFDCDGVFSDGERLAVRVEARLITELSWPFSEADVLERFVGRSDVYMLAEIEHTLGRPVPDWQSRYERELHAAFHAELTTVDGIEAALDAIGLPSGTAPTIRLWPRTPCSSPVRPFTISADARRTHGCSPRP